MSFDLVAELLSVYRKPPDKTIPRLQRLADTIPADAREDVFNCILESLKSTHPIDYCDITDACKKIGVPFSEAHYIPAETWTCDACGKEFKYHPAPSDDDKIDKNIHDVCPQCGFQPCWTIVKRMSGKSWSATAEDIYQKHIAQAIEKHGPKNPYFNWHKAERERAEDKRVAAQLIVDNLDKAKRWDLKDGE